MSPSFEHLFHRGRVRLRRNTANREEPPVREKPESNPFAEYGNFLRNLEAILNAVTGQQPSVARRLDGLTRMLSRSCFTPFSASTSARPWNWSRNVCKHSLPRPLLPTCHCSPSPTG